MLFISRKLFGVGGMQRWSKDFSRVTSQGRGVHLGDIGLSPLGWCLKKLGMRVTATAHGLDVVWDQPWYQWMIRKILPDLDRIVCVSQATAKEVKRRGVSVEKIVVIPCGVWPQLCHTEHSRSATQRTYPKLLSVGRLIPRKGHVWFIRDVLPKLLTHEPTLQYWIVGKGPEETRIRECVYGNRLENHVRLYGEVSDEERDVLLKAANLFVMPNIPIAGDMEGFGIACIEASSRGVPVVASRLEGLQDAVIEGKTGRFFASQNAENCVRVIQELLENPFDSLRVARCTLERYEWLYLFQRYRDEVFSS